MKKINVNLQDKSYSILIGRGLLSKVGRLIRSYVSGSKILIVSNKKIALGVGLLKPLMTSLKKSGFDANYYELYYGNERDKSVQSVQNIWNAMVKAKMDRSSAVLALGGGVVGDVSAFAGSTYMRGIQVVQIPTTLLAQVDSAIGGKTGIDLNFGKNLVGTFHQPRLVISDLETLRHLPLAVIKSSFAEIIKYGVIRDPNLFARLEENGGSFLNHFKQQKLSLKDWKFLEYIISAASKIKADVVSRDEFETKGERMILNYGHTFAHALEGASGYSLAHGEAVGMGMILAARLGVRLSLTPGELERRQFCLIQLLCPSVSLKSLFHRFRLNWEKIKPYFFRDKKALQGVVRFIVPTRLGSVKRVEIKGSDWKLVRSAVESLT